VRQHRAKTAGKDVPTNAFHPHLEDAVDKVARVAERIRDFIHRQKHNYQVGVARLAANKFLVGLTSQYKAIYTVGLGADSVQLGSLSSAGSAISALISAPAGWLMDRHGIKRLFLLAIFFTAGGSLLYALAPDWRFLVAATILSSVALSLSNTGCRVICADSVQSQDRVTAQNVCSTLAALAGLISPLVGAYLVTVFGGMTVEGIRPLYVLQFAGYGLIFIFVAIQLREPQEGQLAGESRFSFIADFRQLFEGRRDLWKWIVISALGSFPMALF
jgi:MFS family permease